MRPMIRFLCCCPLLLLPPAAPCLAESVGPPTTEVVDENTLDFGFLEEIPAGSGGFTFGPSGVSTLGAGAVYFRVDDTGREIFGTDRYNTVPLADFSALGFKALRHFPLSGPLQLSLQINVDYDLTDEDEGWQGRLVYEPSVSGGTVESGVWQTWDALAGMWWSSGAPGNTVCPQNDPCTWAEVDTAFPNAGVHNAELGAIFLKAGGPWAGGFYGLADELVVGTPAALTTFDFETATDLFFDGFESGDVTAWSSSFP